MHPLRAHGLVLRSIGLNLDAIQRHMDKSHHPGLLTELKDLNKQVFQSDEDGVAEFTDAAIVLRLLPVRTRKARSS